MRRLLGWTIAICLIPLASYSQTTKLQADAIVQSYLESNELSDGTWLYSYSTILNGASIVLTGNSTISTPASDCYAYFLDEHPLKGWSHECRLLYVNIGTGTVLSSPINMPPNNLEDWNEHFTVEAIGTGNDNFLFELNNTNSPNTAENCYAVIISGGMNKSSNHIRYWNDCSIVYRVLTQLYGYKDENIYVIMSDGTNPGTDRRTFGSPSYDSSPLDLDNDGDDDIMYSATKSNIGIVFDELEEKLTQDDFLFIFSTDHGTLINNEVYLCLWNEYMSTDDFAAEVDKVNAGSMGIVMEQCFSGGFLPALSKKGRSVATACRADESSYARGVDTYNEFIYHWISAVAGSTPEGQAVDADYNNDGYVSMKEAFDYAEQEDSKPETPLYQSVKPHYGEFLTLYGDNLCSDVYRSFQSYIWDSVIYGCNVTVSDITVTNDALLEIESMGRTVINGRTIIELGSTLIVK